MKKFIFLMVMLSSGFAFGHGLEVGKVYKSDFLLGQGLYTLTVNDADTATLDVDPNRCHFSRLGEKTDHCTRIAVVTFTRKLVVVPVEADRDTLVYSLEGTSYEIVHSLSKGIKLLAVTEGQVLNAVSLR